MNNFTYEEYCKIIGDLYLNAQNQQRHFTSLVDQLKQEITSLKKENKQIKDSCTCIIPKENI